MKGVDKFDHHGTVHALNADRVDIHGYKSRKYISHGRPMSGKSSALPVFEISALQDGGHDSVLMFSPDQLEKLITIGQDWLESLKEKRVETHEVDDH